MNFNKQLINTLKFANFALVNFTTIIINPG